MLFKAEAARRVAAVAGVQTCALRIWYGPSPRRSSAARAPGPGPPGPGPGARAALDRRGDGPYPGGVRGRARDRARRSEERRVGKERRSRGLPDPLKKTARAQRPPRVL